MKKKLGIFSFFLIMSVLLVPALLPQADALSGSQFQPGRIIDDSVFFNNGTMLVGDIQNFLNAKVPVCDTNGTVGPFNGYPTRAEWAAANGKPQPPYICLKAYTQNIPGRSADAYCSGSVGAGNKSAATIIKEVADACGVNPQALIVLLQKEQSLVTDDWPWPVQYEKATGYGCPDTAPCDPEFAGFFNQVWYAARQFQRYGKQPQNYSYRAGSNNFIQYNPNAACGGSTIYIENQATAGLYNYTPYQPNPAALNDLYGSGDLADPAPPNCSAFGNRNFWRMFNDWFGSTYSCESPTVPASTLGIYNPAGFFYERYCHTPGHATRTVQFGNVNWIPLSGDWNKDGVFTPGAYDPATGRFYLRNTNDSGPADREFQYGNVGWTPLAGDWNGNGYWSVGLYDPNTSTFYLKDFNGGGGADYVATFGNNSWKPIVGDWDNNGSTTIGVYSPNTAVYHLNNQNDGSAAEKVFNYGNTGWTPLGGDWDGNGWWSIGAYNPSSSTFYLRNMNDPGAADITVQYGNAGWTPVLGDWDGRR